MAIWNFVDERRILKSLLNNKLSINTNTTQKIIVYIKHLKEKGKSKVEIRNELDNLMMTKYKGFVMADWDGKLRSLVNKYTKKEYREFKVLEDINIRVDELTYIKSFQNIELEKLLFVMLVIGKAAPSKKDKTTNDYWVNCDSKDLFVLSKFKYKTKVDRFEQREYLIYDIKEKGLIEIKNVCDSDGMKLLYGKSEIDENGLTLKLNEDNIDTLVLYYLRWRGEKIKECSECGKLIEVKGTSPIKYCKKCADKIKKIQNNSYRNENEEKLNAYQS